jgi:hypothetical protein
MASINRPVWTPLFCKIILTILPHPLQAEPLTLGAIQGAWIQHGYSCSRTFVRTTKAAEFKKPVNVFESAIVISGSNVTTQGAICRILKSQITSSRINLSLSCRTGLGLGAVKAQLSIADDGTLRRHFDDTDAHGSIYERCNI